jgi:hypothetical protein
MKSVHMNFVACFVGVLLFASKCVCKNVILIPKEGVLGLNVNVLAKEHHLERFAVINGDSFFMTSESRVNAYHSTLTNYFDIEEDSIVSINNRDQYIFSQGNLLNEWHRSHVTRDNSSDNSPFLYTNKGSCHRNNDLLVNTYVIDTGIDVQHFQFDGRVKWGANFADDTDEDCNNHGTHVAGLIGGKDVGLCVDANLYAVKVLSCDGSGTLSSVIQGIEWVYNHHMKLKVQNTQRNVKSIINMSLGGGFSKALNNAVEASLKGDLGLYMVVAAGNENEDSCKSSPASAQSVLTVMASDIDETRAYFSNWGKCGDIYAPGVDIVSSIPNDGMASYSGTSMASPIVAGVLNHYIDMYPDSNQRSMRDLIGVLSRRNEIRRNKKQTVGDFIHLNR